MVHKEAHNDMTTLNPSLLAERFSGHMRSRRRGARLLPDIGTLVELCGVR